MITRGYAKHPCTQSVCTLGLAIRPIRPYPCERMRFDGAPLHSESKRPM